MYLIKKKIANSNKKSLLIPIELKISFYLFFYKQFFLS